MFELGNIAGSDCLRKTTPRTVTVHHAASLKQGNYSNMIRLQTGRLQNQ